MTDPYQQQRDHHHHVVMNCFHLCQQCGAECAERGDASLALCMKLCYACADTCLYCLKLLNSRLPQYKIACRACAEFCDACETECRKAEGELMQRCADACRECADLCRKMAAS